MVVADEWQGVGLGTRLLGIIERFAVANGITHLRGETLC
jgi:GNAT superfamily N-acetyltransferase